MAVTRIADIVVPQVFAPYVIERTAELSALWASGLIIQNEETDKLAGGGGQTVNMPFFKDLTGTSEVLSETTPLTVNNITTGQDVAVISHRGKAWGAQDLAKALSGDDPLAAIGDLVAAWWGRDMQATLIACLKGVFASTEMAAEHVLNLSIPDGNAATPANMISSGGVIDTFKKLGDQTEAIEAIAMHGDIFWELNKQDVIDYLQPSAVIPAMPTYKGKRVIVDDGLPKVAGGTSGFVYSTYLFGQGAVAYGEADDVDGAVETDRDILQGDSYLVNRRTFIIHPIGIKWKGTAAGVSPTNAEFSTAANWQRVYTKKNVPLLELKTNG